MPNLGKEFYQKRKRNHKTTPMLLRHLAQDLNRTMSAKEIAFVHKVTKAWVCHLANRLRNEGFLIPLKCPPRMRWNKAQAMIKKFRREHPELLGNFKAVIYLDNNTYYLSPEETKRLVTYLPKIALTMKVQDVLPNVKHDFSRLY